MSLNVQICKNSTIVQCKSSRDLGHMQQVLYKVLYGSYMQSNNIELR
jgi:hypothetical protein